MILSYVALMHKARKKSAQYGVTFPDFPGCVFAGHGVDKAMQNAREGLIFHIEGLLMAGEILPEPTSLEKIISNPENKEAVPCLIHIIPPIGQVKRVNVSLDADLLAAIDHAAQTLGRNRSEFLAVAARRMLV